MENPNPTIIKVHNRDYLSIIISFIALIVSVLSFYFINIRISNVATATIYSFHDGKDTIIAHIAYVNSGNRQLIILTPEYLVTHYSNDSTFNKGVSLEFEDKPEIVLNPNEIKLVDVAIDKKRIKASFSDSDKNELKSKTRTYIYYGLILKSIALDGDVHYSATNILGGFVTDETRWGREGLLMLWKPKSYIIKE